MLLCQQPQQDDHRPAAALPHAIINHLAGERQHLQTQDRTSARDFKRNGSNARAHLTTDGFMERVRRRFKSERVEKYLIYGGREGKRRTRETKGRAVIGNLIKL